MRIIDRTISAAEAMSLKRALLFILSWIFIRIFFEGVLEVSGRIGFSSFSYRTLLTYFIHFPLFYLSLFFLMVLVIAGLTHEHVSKVTKVCSLGLASILLVPLIDWIVGRGFMITYPLRPGSYFIDFLNPTVSLVAIGVSPGQRIVAVLIALLIGFYGYAKWRNVFRAFGLIFIGLVVIIFFGGFTTLFAGNRPESVFVTGGILYTDTQKYCAIYIILFSVLSFAYICFFNREYFRVFIETARIERIFFYGAMAVFGFGISSVQAGSALEVSLFNYLGIVAIFLSLAFGFWGLQVFNDFFDIDIDRIVDRNNPLLKGVTKDYYSIFGIFLMMMALCYAVIINFPAFLILLTYLLLGIIYSLPPVRLKQIPVISTFALAIAVVLAVALGFTIHYGGRALNAIPAKILIPTVIAITLGFIAKDIGHIEGDKAQGVITLPVLLYNRKTLTGRFPIAALVSASYLVYAFFVPQVLAGAVFFTSITLLYTLVAKRTSELFYFSMLYLFGGYLFYTLIRLMPL